MAAKLVETVQTKYTQYQLVKAFIEGWQGLFGVYPEKKQIAVLWAQNALETGLTVSMWNNNIGNIKYVANTSDTETTQYCMLKGVFEYVNGKKVTFEPPNPATWFRSFDTLAHGVTFYFNFLRNQRYKIAWSAVEAGDPAMFSKLLRQQGYYTAPESAYTALMVQYFNQFMKDSNFEKALAELNPPVPVVTAPVVEAPVIDNPPVTEPVTTPEPVITPITTVSVPLKSGFFGSIGQTLTNLLKAFKRN